MTAKVLATTGLDEDATKRLSEVATVQRNPHRRKLTKEELMQLVADADAVVLGGEEFDRDVIDAAAKLKIIARFGLGYQNIDFRTAAERGIYVTYAPSPALIRAVAEHSLGLVFCCARRFLESDRFVRNGLWNTAPDLIPLPVLNLKNRTLGIVGLGRIGSELAQMAHCLDMNLLYYDVYRKEGAENQYRIRYVKLEELLRQSDFVSVNCPLTDKTRGMIGRRELSLMKKSAYLINTARGAIVDREALYHALQTKSIAGAAFDVFWEEPISAGDPILLLDDFVFTPHNSPGDPEVGKQVGSMIAGDIVRVLEGEKPINVIPELKEATNSGPRT